LTIRSFKPIIRSRIDESKPHVDHSRLDLAIHQLQSAHSELDLALRSLKSAIRVRFCDPQLETVDPDSNWRSEASRQSFEARIGGSNVESPG
jgi:hypothetical protein